MHTYIKQILFLLKTSLIVLVLLSIGVSERVWAVEISKSQESLQLITEPLSIELSTKLGTITKIINLRDQKTLSNGSGGVYLINGATGNQLMARGAVLKYANKNEAKFIVDFPEPGISVTYQIIVGSKGIFWKVAISNNSQTMQMYEVRLGLPINFVKKEYNYWDGYDQHFESAVSPIFQKCTERSNLYAINALPTKQNGGKRPKFPFSKNLMLGNVCIFPMNCLWGHDFGVALGVSPLEPISYYSGGVQPVISSNDSFYYSLKYVIMPGETETQTFVLYSFPARGGFRAALNTYYDLFPQEFARPSQVPEKVFLPATGGFFSTLANLYEHDLGDLWGEFCRRYYIGWMWFYAPFQETGEWFTSPENYRSEDWIKKADPLSKGRQARTKEDRFARTLGTYPAYVDYLQRIIAYARRSLLIGWYINPERCSTRLADQSFKDAIIFRWNTNIPYYMPSGVTEQPQYSMFALNNSFAEKTKEDIKKILTVAKANAIAFDNALAFEHFAGPGVLGCPGKAFRDGKVYVVNNLSYQNLEKYVHQLNIHHSPNYRSVVFTNVPFNIATAQYTDACLIEYHPYQPANMVSAFGMLRYLLGPQKAISFKVHGRSEAPQITGPQPAKQPLNEIYNERLHSLLALFRWGAFPMISTAMGDPDIIAAVPLLLRLFRSSWEPLPGVDFDGNHLWVERFGKGMDTHLSIINYTQRPCTDVLEVNKDLGKGLIFFESVYGDYLESLVENGRSKIKLGIQPVWLSVAQSFLHFLPSTTGLNAAADISHQYQDGRKVDKIKLTLSGETAAELNFPRPPGAADIRILINGKAVAADFKNNSLKCQYLLGRENVIEISYLEELQLQPGPEAVLACDFLHGNDRGGTIVCQDTSLKESAEKIRNYFLYYHLAEDFERYYQSNGRTPVPDKTSVKGLSEIVTNDQPGRSVISLSVDTTLPSLSKVTVISNNLPYQLKIEARSAKDLDAAVLGFLRLLDKKYTRYGYDGVHKKSWLEPGLLAKDMPGCKRMGWIEFINYKKSFFTKIIH